MTTNELFLITETPFWVLRNTGKMEFLKKSFFTQITIWNVILVIKNVLLKNGVHFITGGKPGPPEGALPVILLYYAMYQLLV